MNSLHWQSYCLFLLQIGLLSTFLYEQMQSAILTSKTINALIQMLYPTMGYDITITQLLFVSELYFVPVKVFPQLNFSYQSMFQVMKYYNRKDHKRNCTIRELAFPSFDHWKSYYTNSYFLISIITVFF